MIEIITISDRRTGRRPALIVPTSNSSDRLRSQLSYYSPAFDLIILDQLSTDGTLQLAAEAGASVWGVEADEDWGSIIAKFCRGYADQNVFHTVLYCDEFVSLEALISAVQHCAAEHACLLSRPVHWFYGYRLKAAHAVRFRGGFPSHFPAAALEDESAVEVGLSRLIDVEHMQVISVSRNFGTCGTYAAAEIRNGAAKGSVYFGYFKRFVVVEFLRFSVSLRRGWTGISGVIGWFMISSCSFAIATLALLERQFLPDENQQMKEFQNFKQKVRDEDAVWLASLPAHEFGHISGQHNVT